MIEIGSYYRCEKADEIEVRRGRAPSVGELVLVVDIATNRVEFASGKSRWYEDLESFDRDYVLVTDGAGEREREISALLEAVRTAQAASTALSAEIAAQPLLDSGLDATDSIAISTEGATKARLRVADVRNQVARVRQSLSERKARLRALLDEQESAIEAQAKRLEGWLEKANDAIWAINLYLGRDETIVRLSDGAPAEPDEPIVVRQLVLYMDEETAIGAADGGIDATNLAAFDAWVCEPEHLGRVLPERRGVVAFKARRKTRDYGDSFRNAQMAQANQHSISSFATATGSSGSTPQSRWRIRFSRPRSNSTRYSSRASTTSTMGNTGSDVSDRAASNS